MIQDLRAVADGDRTAWERLVQALAARLHAVAHRILGDQHAAEDATQDAFLALGRAAAGFHGDDDAAVERWAVAIACRIALMHARGRGRRERRVRTGLPAEVETMAAESGRESVDPDTLAAAMSALRRLPERHRLPIVLHVFGSLDGAELARELGISANAARVRLHRSLKKLEALLASEGVGVAPAILCADLAKAPPPPPSHELLERCRGLAWSAPPPSLAIAHKGSLMASSAAAGLALAAWLTVAHLGSASEAPASTQADPPHAAAPAAPRLTLHWQCEGPTNITTATPPMVVGDAVLLCGDDELACGDRRTGARRWRLPGEFHHCRPGVHGDEAIVMMRDTVQAIALKDGRSRWLAALDGAANDASVVVRGDRAYIATRAGTLWCLDLSRQGASPWKLQHTLPQDGAWAPGIGSRGDLLLPLWHTSVVCIDERTGNARWTARIPGLGREPPVARDGLAYALAEDPTSHAGELIALDEATGAERWRREVPQDDRDAQRTTTTIRSGDGAGVMVKAAARDTSQEAVGAVAGPVIADDTLVVGSTADLLGYAPDGALRWRVPCAPFVFHGFTVDAQGRVWAGGDDGELLVVSTGGRELLRLAIDGDPGIARHPVTRWTEDRHLFATVGGVSNPAVDGDQCFVLTTGGVALCFATKARP